MQKQPHITEQTRANLLQAFWRLYLDKPLDRITVKEITAKAGYNRGTFYEYFRDVRHCLDSIEAQCLPSFHELPPLPTAEELATEPSAELDTPFFDAFIELYQQKFDYYDVLLGERGDPLFQRRLIDGIKSLILKNAVLPAGLDREQLDFALEYMLCGLIGVLRHYFHTRPRASKAEVMLFMYRVMGSQAADYLRFLKLPESPKGQPAV